MIRSRRQYDFLPRPDALHPVAGLHLDARRPLAVEQDSPRERLGEHLEVGPLHRGPQVRARRRHAPAVPYRALPVTVAVRLGHVEVLALLVAERRDARVEGLAQPVAAAREADAHRTAG